MPQLFRYLLAVGLMVGSVPAVLNARGEDRRDRNCCDTPQEGQEDIVGVWLFNRTDGTNADEQYGVRVFFADGTTIQHISGAISQPTHVSPDGDYFTINTGVWKKTGKNTYKVIDTGVWLRKDITANSNLHGEPLARLKTEFDFTLDRDCVKATAEGFTRFFLANDLTLTKNSGFPVVTPPVPTTPQAFTAVARRLSSK